LRRRQSQRACGFSQEPCSRRARYSVNGDPSTRQALRAVCPAPVSKQDAGHKTTARFYSILALEAAVVPPQARNATEQGETGGMDRNILERRAKQRSGPGTAKLFHCSCNSEARRFVIDEHSEKKSREGTFREGARFLTSFE